MKKLCYFKIVSLVYDIKFIMKFLMKIMFILTALIRKINTTNSSGKIGVRPLTTVFQNEIGKVTKYINDEMYEVIEEFYKTKK